MKIEVHPQGGQRRVIELEPGATKGATVGVNVWNQDGTLFVPQTAAPEEGGPPITYWRLILEIPPNVVALAETATTGLYVITGNGTSETRAIQAKPGETTVSNGDGVAGDPVVGLADVEDSGEGALLAITRDSKGRVTGTREATITGTAGQIDVANGDAVAGLPTISLADVADAGGGSIRKFDRDAKGRVSGTSAATTDDLTEGASNLYFTDERAQDATGAVLDDSGDVELRYETSPARRIWATLSSAVQSALSAAVSALQPGDNVSELVNDAGYTTNAGTVTSVGLSVPAGLTVSGSPITSSGTITVSYDTGYQGYTSAEASKLSGVEAGATAGADWSANLANIPANISAWAGISPSSKYNTPTGTIAQYIRGDGTLAAFPSIPAGTVTSVGLSAPTGLTVSGSPVTGAGTLTLSYASGYQGYTSAEASKLSGIAAGATANSGSTSVADVSGSFQRAALTGDVTASQNSNSTTIANGVVTNAKLANMPQSTIKGRGSGSGPGAPVDLTVAQARALIGTSGSVANYSSAVSGYGPDEIVFTGNVLAGSPLGTTTHITGRSNANGRVLQFLAAAAGGSDPVRVGVRTSHPTNGGGGWTGLAMLWHTGNLTDSGWQSLTLQNGWTNTGGAWATAQCRKFGSKVTVRGVISPGTTANGTLIATLPTGFRPSAQQQFVVGALALGAPTNMRVATNGQITIYDASGSQPTSMHMEFYVD